MKPKHLSALSFLIMTLGLTSLASCGPQAEKSITVENLNLMVDQSVNLEEYVTFTPLDSIDTLNFTIIEGNNVAAINENNYLTALAVGEAKIKAETDNTGVSDFFTVFVSANTTDYWATFNHDGTFDNGLGGFTLSGSTASLHTVEADVDRSAEGQAFKLWTGDYSADPVTSSLVDVTLAYEFSDPELSAGTYTLMFDLVGSLSTIEVTVNDNVFTLADGDVVNNAAKYVTNYLVFTLSGEALDLSMYFYGEDRNNNWGFLDNVCLEAGDQTPVVEPETSLVTDGGFENIGVQEGVFANQTAWILTGTVGTNDWGSNLKFNSDAAYFGSYGLNYWHGSTSEDDFTISQIMTAEASLYQLSFAIYSGDYNATNSANTKITLIQGEVIVLSEFLSPSASYVVRDYPDLSLSSGEVRLEIRFQTTASNTWIKLDDITLSAQA